MAEPRFKKSLEDEKRKKHPSVISPETLLKKEVAEKPAAEEIAPLFKGIDISPCAGSSCAACNECGGERKW